jgi:hypothetical protein
VSELYKVREDCRSVKKELEKTNMSTLDALLGDEQRRLIAEVAEVFGQTTESLMLLLAHQIKNTAGFVGENPEKQLRIVASRLTKLEEELQQRRQESGSTSGGAGQPPANTGTSMGGSTQTGDKRTSSRGQWPDGKAETNPGSASGSWNSGNPGQQRRSGSL